MLKTIERFNRKEITKVSFWDSQLMNHTYLKIHKTTRCSVNSQLILYNNSCNTNLLKLIILIFLTLTFSVVMVVPAVSYDTNSQIDSKGIKVFPLDSAPYNTTYSEWTAKWWKWALEIPKEQNPVSDTTGKNCAQGQEGPVWFLAGTYGGDRTIMHYPCR